MFSDLNLRRAFLPLSSHSHPSLHDMGHFIIPPGFGPPKLQLFLQRHAHEARERTQRQKL